MTVRRTQAERRAATRHAILDAATHLFGQRGFTETQVSDIAALAGVTVRPIYYYFGSKEDLFESVVRREEARLSAIIGRDDVEGAALTTRLRASLELLSDPAFQRIVLMDSPAVLGRERWTSSEVVRTVEALMNALLPIHDPLRRDLLQRMAVGAMTAAVLSLTEEECEDERSRRLEALYGLISQALHLLGRG